MNNGLAMEMEEVGMVAIIGLILVPGAMWVGNGKSLGSKLVRGMIVGAAIAAAAMIESSLDNTVNSAAGALEGNS
jgi:hypothetical protein